MLSRAAFLASNFRFLVSDAAPGLARASVDPDVDVDFADVAAAEVLLDVSERQVCPVCLEEPDEMVGPQLTPCGHVYCFTCVMRMLAHGAEGGGAKCAVCQSVVRTDALRCAMLRTGGAPQQPAAAMARLRFTLVRRRKGSAVALPPSWPSEGSHDHGFPRAGVRPPQGARADGNETESESASARDDGGGSWGSGGRAGGSLCCPFSRVTLCTSPASAECARALERAMAENAAVFPEEAAVAEMCLSALQARDEEWMRRRAAAIAARSDPRLRAELTMVGGGGVGAVQKAVADGARAHAHAHGGAQGASTSRGTRPRGASEPGGGGAPARDSSSKQQGAAAAPLDSSAPAFVPSRTKAAPESDAAAAQAQEKSTTPAVAEYYYAYQLSDGRARFVHPLSMVRSASSLARGRGCACARVERAMGC